MGMSGGPKALEVAWMGCLVLVLLLHVQSEAGLLHLFLVSADPALQRGRRAPFLTCQGHCFSALINSDKIFFSTLGHSKPVKMSCLCLSEHRAHDIQE
jgi:hypothetical protein